MDRSLALAEPPNGRNSKTIKLAGSIYSVGVALPVEAAREQNRRIAAYDDAATSTAATHDDLVAHNAALNDTTARANPKPSSAKIAA